MSRQQGMDHHITFQEVDLRPDPTHDNDGVPTRPQSTSKFHNFFSSAVRKTFSKKKRRHTTAAGDIDLLKNSISLPTNCSQLKVSEVDIELSNNNSIHHCPFDITGYGQFLLMDQFRTNKPKKMTIMVFLYEKIIIFTKKQLNEDSFYYMGSLKLDQVALMPQEKNKKKLELKDHWASTKFHKDVVISLEAPSEYIQTEWRKAIEKCLWGQLLKAKREADDGVRNTF